MEKQQISEQLETTNRTERIVNVLHQIKERLMLLPDRLGVDYITGGLNMFPEPISAEKDKVGENNATS
jgi:hypothetical protein